MRHIAYKPVAGRDWVRDVPNPIFRGFPAAGRRAGRLGVEIGTCVAGTIHGSAGSGLCSVVRMPHPTAPIAAILAAALSGAAFAQQFVQQMSTRFPVQAEYTNPCAVVDFDGSDLGTTLGNWG